MHIVRRFERASQLFPSGESRGRRIFAAAGALGALGIAGFAGHRWFRSRSDQPTATEVTPAHDFHPGDQVGQAPTVDATVADAAPAEAVPEAGRIDRPLPPVPGSTQNPNTQ